MIDRIEKLLHSENVFPHNNAGTSVAQVSNSHEGLHLARKILLTIVNEKTLLLLSGGRTPKELYISLAKEENFHPGAVGLIDERYGEKNHKNSNELMLSDSGLLDVLSQHNIAFYPMLQEGVSREETAEMYDDKLRSLFSVYQTSIALLGIGLDGHTAGIPASSVVWKEGFAERSKYALVSEYDDHGVFYNERVTMTFLGLSLMDVLLVLVFGDDKKEALNKVFETGLKEAVPGRFYKDAEVAKKTIFITDQDV